MPDAELSAWSMSPVVLVGDPSELRSRAQVALDLARDFISNADAYLPMLQVNIGPETVIVRF